MKRLSIVLLILSAVGCNNAPQSNAKAVRKRDLADAIYAPVNNNSDETSDGRYIDGEGSIVRNVFATFGTVLAGTIAWGTIAAAANSELSQTPLIFRERLPAPLTPGEVDNIVQQFSRGRGITVGSAGGSELVIMFDENGLDRMAISQTLSDVDDVIGRTIPANERLAAMETANLQVAQIPPDSISIGQQGVTGEVTHGRQALKSAQRMIDEARPKFENAARYTSALISPESLRANLERAAERGVLVEFAYKRAFAWRALNAATGVVVVTYVVGDIVNDIRRGLDHRIDSRK